MITGHLAVSALLNRYLDAQPLPVLAATVFPDLVDKSLCQILGVTRSGRMFAHTLLSVAISTAVAYQFWGARTARSWALGYLAHLLCDIGGFVPWFYPFVRYEFIDSPSLLAKFLEGELTRPHPIEIGLFIWAIVAHTNGTDSRHEAARRR